MSQVARSLIVGAVALVVVCVVNVAAPAWAITFPYIQNFDVDTADASTDPAYAEFTLSGAGPAYVSGGVLYLGNGGTTNFNFPSVSTTPGLSTDIVLQVDLSGIDVAAGSSRAEMKLGAVNALFHVGYGGGAFRLEGAVSQGNTDMGYTPAAGVLHHFTARSYGDGQFDISIANGSNLLQVFTAGFYHPASVGQTFGLRYLSTGTGIFDNLSIRYAAELVANYAVDSVINFSGMGNFVDMLQLTNGGLNASALEVTSYSISGANASSFALTNFAPATLTVGGSNSVGYDMAFLGGPAGQTVNALLTLHTNIGDFNFELTSTLAPEPSSVWMLGLGAVLVSRRRRRSTERRAELV